jgi:hypothetical protein
MPFYSRRRDYRNYSQRDAGVQQFQSRSMAQAPAVTCDFTAPKWVAFKAVQPARAAWVEAKVGSPNFDFPEKMFAAVVRFGDLTQGQGEAIDRMVARDAQRASQRPVSVRLSAPTLFPNIRAAFDRLIASGGSKPVTIGDVTLSLAKANSANPGAVYVKVGGVYMGKIVDTTFYAGRDATAEVAAKLVAIEADPRAAVQAHAARVAAALEAARVAGQPISLPCGCCGLTLTDPVSVARGIGPICAGKWGF